MAGMSFDTIRFDRRNYGRRNLFSLTIDTIPDISFSVVRVSGLFSYSVNVEIYSVGNEPIKAAGRPELAEVQLVIHDHIEAKIADKLYEWFTKVYDPKTGAVGVPMQYKRNGGLYQFDVKGERIRAWRLEGIWPSQLDFGDFDYTSEGEVIEVTATIQVDRTYRK